MKRLDDCGHGMQIWEIDVQTFQLEAEEEEKFLSIDVDDCQKNDLMFFSWRFFDLIWLLGLRPTMSPVDGPDRPRIKGDKHTK